MAAGRKPIYDIKSLKIGQKMALPESIREYRHQYLRNFHKSDKQKKFKLVEAKSKLFVERIS